MRKRTLLALALMSALPTLLVAQRAGRTGGIRRPGVDGTDEPTRQPEPIARAAAISRSRVSLETYPLFSKVQSSPLTTGMSAFGFRSVGAGAHMEWRTSSMLSAAGDVTSTFYGASAITNSVELGARLRPTDWDHALRPYADLRAAYIHSGSEYGPLAASSPFGSATAPPLNMQYSRGYGLVAGAGAEYWITSSFALTGGVANVQSRMHTYDHTGALIGSPDYWMNNYRLTLGLRFNQARNTTSAMKQPR